MKTTGWVQSVLPSAYRTLDKDSPSHTNSLQLRQHHRKVAVSRHYLADIEERYRLRAKYIAQEDLDGMEYIIPHESEPSKTHVLHPSSTRCGEYQKPMRLIRTRMMSSIIPFCPTSPSVTPSTDRQNLSHETNSPWSSIWAICYHLPRGSTNVVDRYCPALEQWRAGSREVRGYPHPVLMICDWTNFKYITISITRAAASLR